MVKKSTAQNGDPGNNVMASVNTLNANPGPLATYKKREDDKSCVQWSSKNAINMLYGTYVKGMAAFLHASLHSCIMTVHLSSTILSHALEI